jgi:hypothetical protein
MEKGGMEAGKEEMKKGGRKGKRRGKGRLQDNIMYICKRFSQNILIRQAPL